MKCNHSEKEVLNAIKNDNLRKFVSLLSSKEDNFVASFQEINANVQRKCGLQILHLCAQFNSYKICEEILSKEKLVSLVDSRDVEGKTAIHQCSIFGSSDCARVILVNGAQVDALKRGDWSPLMHSVARADLQLVALLLENGADIRICNKDGWNAIALATRTGNQHLLDMLEKHSLLKHFHSAWHIRTKNGRTLLHIAAMNGHIHFANRFLADSFFAKPLDVNATDVCGVTPFMDAARIDSLEMCQLFKHYSGNSFNVNQVDASGRSALHMAAQANATSVVKYLVSELQCEKNLEDVWHQTALFLAVREGHLEMTELLLQLGAKRTSDGHKRTLLDIAKQYNHQHLLPYFS